MNFRILSLVFCVVALFIYLYCNYYQYLLIIQCILLSLFLFMILQNLNNRESVEPRWRPGTQGRGARGGRGNFSPHNVSHGE